MVLKKHIACFVTIILFVFFPLSLWGTTDTDALSGRIANSLVLLPGAHYKNIAFSRVKKRSSSVQLDTNELIDFTNVKIVRSRRFRVTDRTKLQLILTEQRVQFSEFVSPNEYKELGKILGVQLFVYGSIYSDALILKAIDVQNSGIAWADVFTLDNSGINHQLLIDLNQKLAQSLRKERSVFRQEQISKVSFWNIEVPRRFSSDQVIDYLTATISKNQLFTVIDRENLKLIATEQKLNQSVFIDESQARRLGELYGVDAFLYGTITPKGNNTYIASLKMMSIFSGVIVWADLIRFNLPEKQNQGTLVNPFEEKIRKRQMEEGRVVGMVKIKGGTFVVGSDDPMYNSPAEKRIQLKSFFIDSYEVTNEEYLEFVTKRNHRFPTFWENGTFDRDLKDHPVVGVSWEDAKLYCQFKKKRLPTENEWEAAFRGRDGRQYPWKGPNFSSSFTVTLESDIRTSVSVKQKNRDVTPEKVYHMAGNVREYVADFYRPAEASDEIISAKERVVRGSSWAQRAYEAVGYYRGHTRPNLAWPDIGFRCAMDS